MRGARGIRARRRVAACAALGVLVSLGCTTRKSALLPDDAFLPAASLSRSTGVVLEDGRDEQLARGAVLRVTFERAIVVALVPRTKNGPFRVRIAEDVLPALELGREGELLVLSVSRDRRDIRPLELAPGAPAPKASLQVIPPPRAGKPESAPLACFASEEPPPGRAASPEVAWLATAPEEGERDDRAPGLRAREERGGLVLDAAGRLQGFVADPDGELPRFLVASRVASRLQQIVLGPGGADLLRPDDGFLEHVLRIESIEGLPRVAEEEGGGPMLVLEVKIAGELAGRIEVTPGRKREEAFLVARDTGPVVVTLVALDRSLAKGETREELSQPAELPRIRERLQIALPLRQDVLERYGLSAAQKTTRASLSLTSIDPDALTGPARSLVGASPIALGRLADGSLDLRGGRATRFLVLDASAAEPIAAVLLRRRLGAALELRAFHAGFDADVLKVAAPVAGPRIVMATGRLLRGRAFLRLRQVGGDAGTGYELLVAGSGDAASLVGPIFRLVSREASFEGTAFLDSDPFVDDVANVLEIARFPREQVARALVEELGNRVQVARRLALLLLERHFRPPKAVLQEALSQNGPAANDAGLILAELDPQDEKLRVVVRRACKDPDPFVRARAARIAARSGDAKFALEVVSLLEEDAAPIVERAVEAARLAAKK